MIRSNTIKNCPVTVQDIDIAEDILGPSTAAMKGTIIKSRFNQVTQVNSTRAVVPYKIINTHKNITLCGDNMHVEKLPFMVTITGQVKILTAE